MADDAAQVLRVLVLIDKTMQPLDLVLIDRTMPKPAWSCASPKKCRNPVPAATWWLHDPKKEKARYRIDSALSLCSLVGPRGVEPRTNGL